MAIGDTIRPELGRTDFTPFMQGSMAGSAALGQGISNLGAGIGKFLGDKAEAKKAESKGKAAIKAFMTLNPEYEQAGNMFLQKIDQEDSLSKRAAMASMGEAFAKMGGEKADRDMMKQSIFFDQGMQKANLARLLNQDLMQREQFDQTMQFREEDSRRDFRTNERNAEFNQWLQGRKLQIDEQNANTQEMLLRRSAGPDFDNLDNLRKEATALPELKDFKKVDAAYKKVQKAAENPSAAGDLSLIFGYMKILDPGSVVREGEFATAQNAAGVPDRIINLYNRIKDGERLNEAMRADFIKQAQLAAEAQYKQIEPTVAQMRRIAEERGFNPDDVVPSYYTQFQKQGGEPGGLPELSPEDQALQGLMQGANPLLPPKPPR